MNFNINIKKTIRYILLALIITIIGFFIFFYYVDQKNNQSTNDNTNVSTETGFFGGLFGKKELTSDTVSTSSYKTNSEINSTSNNQENGNITVSRLLKISKSPVAGFIVFQKNKDDIAVRYIEKSTGHIYETDMKSLKQVRVSNTTIPKIYKAIWINPTTLIIRYLDDDNNIKSFYGKIKDTEKNKSLEGFFLVDNIKELISAGNQFFYLLTNDSSSQGVVSDSSGKNNTQIFSSPLRELLVQRPQKGVLAFTTKPSYEAPGYLFFFNVNKGSQDSILSEIKGLTTLVNHNDSTVLFSKSVDNLFSLETFDIKTNKIKEIKPITLPEKCVWSKDNENVFCGVPKTILKGNYPDIWYQGKVSFSDDIWKFNIKDNIQRLLISPKDYVNTDIDLIKPVLSSNENYLFFINKKDSSLWVLNMK